MHIIDSGSFNILIQFNGKTDPQNDLRSYENEDIWMRKFGGSPKRAGTVSERPGLNAPGGAEREFAIGEF